MKTVIAIFAAMLAFNANADAYSIQFTASGGWSSIWGDVASPYDTISGSMSWTTQGPSGPVEKVTAIDLTIEGHRYTPDEVLFLNDDPNGYYFGGVLGYGANVLGAGRDDFAIHFSRPGHYYPMRFYYATPTTENVWWTDAPNLSVHISAVPESSAGAMLGLGLLALSAGGWARARKQRGRANAARGA